MTRAFAAIAFTPETLALQEADGSARGYAPFLAPEAEPNDALGPVEAAFIQDRDGFYQASVNSAGWPYVQFRGGAPGFVHVLSGEEIAWADLRGNRQHLSAGNIAHDGRVSLFFMDYPNRRRLKLWGEARLVRAEDDPDLAERLHPGGRARVQRLVRVAVRAFDWNCPQHIPQRFTTAEIAEAVAPLHARIAELEAEAAALRAPVQG